MANPPNKSEVTRQIAMILIFAFIGFVLIFIILAAAQIFEVDNIQLIGAMWGPWVGAIVGYYFGGKPVEDLTTTNRNLSDMVARSNEKLRRTEKAILESKVFIQNSVGELKKAGTQDLKQVEDSLQKATDKLDSILEEGS